MHRGMRLREFSNVLLTPTILLFLSSGAPITGSSTVLAGDVDYGASHSAVVFELLGETEFSGQPGDHIEVEHDDRFELAEGTITLRFVAVDVMERHGLLSKDFTGNREGGDLTVFVEQGRVKVRLQSAEESIWAKTPEGSVQAGQEYHLAVTFGPSGLWVYLNGQISAWAPEFDQGLERNVQNLAIGASIWARTERDPYGTWDHFAGRISGFTIYRTQFDPGEVAAAAGIDPEPEPTEPYVMNGRLYGIDEDEVLHAGSNNVNDVHGGYGNDRVVGTRFNDTLDGGHGEDRLVGGEGDDLLISLADGREPVIAQEYGPEDDPDHEINPLTRTYYPDQPIEADDVLIGGGGADTFHFRVLINAKREIILRHIKPDGTIEWGMHGVAGENDEVHDHWVERLGDEVIWDFSRAEGDHIEVVGHTVEVYRRVHEDSDGDATLDSTVLHVRSNQGNGGGAHNKDLLGTIRVFGDLVMRSDYTVEKIDYGIVPTIAELEEAISPPVYTSVADDGTPPPFPEIDDGELPAGAVFGVAGEVVFNQWEEDHIEVAHHERFELAEGTVALRFAAEDVWERGTLFSKDFTGNRDGGDLTVFVEQSRVKVRLQSAAESIWAKTPEGSVQAGQEYHLAVTFGPAGLQVYVDGRISARVPEFIQGLEMNVENLAIGASTWARTNKKPYATWDHFTGKISQFIVFSRQYDDDDVATLLDIPNDPIDPPNPVEGGPMDREGDGMSDVWQNIYGIDASETRDDPDGDGQTNIEEAIAGTNPFDPDSFFAVTTFNLTADGLDVAWPSIEGMYYVIQCSADMIEWHDVGTKRIGVGDHIGETLSPLSDHLHVRVRILNGIDRDGDRLTDWEEGLLGTDSRLVDTDGDGVSDGDEIHVHNTDPTTRDGTDPDETIKSTSWYRLIYWLFMEFFTRKG